MRMISSCIRQSRSAQVRPCRSSMQQLLGGSAAFGQRGLQPLRDRGAQFALAPRIVVGELCKLSRDRIGVDERGRLRSAGESMDREYRSADAVSRCRDSGRFGLEHRVGGEGNLLSMLDNGVIYSALTPPWPIVVE